MSFQTAGLLNTGRFAHGAIVSTSGQFVVVGGAGTASSEVCLLDNDLVSCEILGRVTLKTSTVWYTISMTVIVATVITRFRPSFPSAIRTLFASCHKASMKSLNTFTEKLKTNS